MEKENLEKIFEFLSIAGNLKFTYRWSEFDGIPKDSSADHSWRLALMGFIIAEELSLKIDVLKALKIALVHDIAESITGDIDYRKIVDGKFSKEEKERLEILAIEKMKNILPEKIGNELNSLWKEYEEGLSAEAKYIRALDKIESITHVFESSKKIKNILDKRIKGYGEKQVEEFPGLIEVLEMLNEKMKNHN